MDDQALVERFVERLAPMTTNEMEIVFARVGAHYAKYGIRLARAVEAATIERLAKRAANIAAAAAMDKGGDQ